jgi:hypothetical protein
MSFHRFAVLTEQGESGVKMEELKALFASAGAKLSGEYWKASPQGFAGDPSLLTNNA